MQLVACPKAGSFGIRPTDTLNAGPILITFTDGQLAFFDFGASATDTLTAGPILVTNTDGQLALFDF